MYGYKEVERNLNKLLQKNKDKMTLNTIGLSLDNRKIYQVILGNSNSKKHFLVQAGIHGREYMTTYLVMKQLEYYLDYYYIGRYKGIKYNDLFDKVAFHLLPLTNPDGVTISQSGIAKLKNKKYRNIIKKCYIDDMKSNYTTLDFKNYLIRWKANARGVDLNRNFDAGFSEIKERDKASSENYKGESAESEPETKAIVKVTESYDFAGTISYHSSGSIIYWDYKDSLVKKESSIMADIAKNITGYSKALSDDEYENVMAGGYKDYASSKKDNPIPSLTIEIGKEESPLDFSEFKDIFDRNYLIFSAFAEYIEREY